MKRLAFIFFLFSFNYLQAQKFQNFSAYNHRGNVCNNSDGFVINKILNWQNKVIGFKNQDRGLCANTSNGVYFEDGGIFYWDESKNNWDLLFNKNNFETDKSFFIKDLMVKNDSLIALMMVGTDKMPDSDIRYYYSIHSNERIYYIQVRFYYINELGKAIPYKNYELNPNEPAVDLENYYNFYDPNVTRYYSALRLVAENSFDFINNKMYFLKYASPNDQEAKAGKSVQELVIPTFTPSVLGRIKYKDGSTKIEDCFINRLEKINNKIYIYGKLDEVNNEKKYSGIAEFDGSTWNNFNGILQKRTLVNDVEYWNGQLYISEQDTDLVNNVTKSGISTWNGIEWLPSMPLDSSYFIEKLFVMKDSLYAVCNYFEQIVDSNGRGYYSIIQKFNGITWEKLTNTYNKQYQYVDYNTNYANYKNGIVLQSGISNSENPDGPFYRSTAYYFGKDSIVDNTKAGFITNIKNSQSDFNSIYYTNSILYVNSNNNQNNIKVIDMLGRVVFSEISNSNEIDLNLQTGFYIVLITNNKQEQLIKKICIQN